jgi:hypothetical protein
LLYFASHAREQVGRSLLAFLQFEIQIWGLGRQERKVRTLQGSEPANGGAFQHNLRFEISDLRFWDDDKCNRKQTSHGIFDFRSLDLKWNPR